MHHKTRKGWHFLPADMRLTHNDNRPVKVGGVLRAKGPISLCYSGMHASPTISAAARFARGPVLCYVTVGGITGSSYDKFVGTWRRVEEYKRVDQIMKNAVMSFLSEMNCPFFTPGSIPTPELAEWFASQSADYYSNKLAHIANHYLHGDFINAFANLAPSFPVRTPWEATFVHPARQKYEEACKEMKSLFRKNR